MATDLAQVEEISVNPNPCTNLETELKIELSGLKGTTLANVWKSQTEYFLNQ